MVCYEISAESLQRHIWRVTLQFTVENHESVEISFPNWTAGSYLIRHFCKHVCAVHAECAGNVHMLQQTDKNTWQIPPVNGQWRVSFEVYALDFSVRGAYLDENRGFINGAAVFPFIRNRRREPCSVVFRLPENWEIATALKENNGIFQAASYEALLDAPFEMGRSGSLKTLRFTAQNIPHRIVLSGSFVHLDAERLAGDIQKICTEHLKMFRHAPFADYTFLLHIGDNAYGGLEHLSSSALMASRRNLPSLRGTNRDEYIVLLGLFSHEYFHAWNVKTIRPQAFAQSDGIQEAYTEQLWAFEGITSYYDDLALVRSGVISRAEYWQLVLKNIDAVHSKSGRLRQSLAESSFNAWTKFYCPDENTPNASVSYYQKGSLAALALDIFLRRSRAGSLDDVMRALYAHARANPRGLPEGFWQTFAEKTSGISLQNFFQKAVYGTEDWDWNSFLPAVGAQIRFQAAAAPAVVAEFPAPVETLTFGAVLRDAPGGKTVQHVADGSIAQEIGLNAGDTLLAANRYGTAEWTQVWDALRPGDTLTLHWLRRNVLHENSITLRDARLPRPLLKITDPAAADDWLKGH